MKDNERNLAIQLVIDVAKAGNLRSDHHGDITLLSNTISCTRRYAKDVLVSIECSNENELFKRDTHCDSIHVSDWHENL